MWVFLGLELAKLSCCRVAMYIFLGLELAVLSFLVPYLPTSAFLYCVFKKKNVLCKRHLKRYLSFGMFHPLTRTVTNLTISRLCHGTIPENTVHMSWPLLPANRICSFCLLCLFHEFSPFLTYFGLTEYFNYSDIFPFQIF